MAKYVPTRDKIGTHTMVRLVSYPDHVNPDQHVDWVVVGNVLEHAHVGVEARLSGELLWQGQLVQAHRPLGQKVRRSHLEWTVCYTRSANNVRCARLHTWTCDVFCWYDSRTLNLPTILSSSARWCSSSSPALPLYRLKVWSQSSKLLNSPSNSLLYAWTSTNTPCWTELELTSMYKLPVSDRHWHIPFKWHQMLPKTDLHRWNHVMYKVNNKQLLTKWKFL